MESSSKDVEPWCEETTSLLMFDQEEDNTASSNPIRPAKTVVVDEESTHDEQTDTTLISIGSPGSGSRQRTKESKKYAVERENTKEEKESVGKRPDEIAFVSNDDLPDPVLYADGCVDDNKIIMLCQRQEMERL
uniref:Uncharacterized protein n=1 Tax=Anopheles maculatus TaxID=74869 RepID=A0A182SID7_9DIPT